MPGHVLKLSKLNHPLAFLSGTVLLCCAAVLFTARNLAKTYSALRVRHDPRGAVVQDAESYLRGGNWLGSPDAFVVLVAWFDYGCPACRRFGQRLRDLQRRYPGYVALLVRDLPVTPIGVDAAVAARCAARQGAFEKVFYFLVERVGDLSGNQVQQDYLETLPVPDVPALRACFHSLNRDSVFAEDLEDAARLGIAAVPSLLIGSRLYEGVPRNLDDLISDMVDKKQDGSL